jgi:aspartokinase/homoserine dehydrogenase 1
LENYCLLKLLQKQYNKKIKSSGYKDSREAHKNQQPFGKAAVNFDVTNAINQRFFATISKLKLVVMPGFIASTEDGITYNFGSWWFRLHCCNYCRRFDAKDLEIWTDVNGMFTANPKIVKQAQPIATISYQEAMELSHFGAKVLYPPTIQPVLRKNIPILIKNTFEPEAEGTYISNEM